MAQLPLEHTPVLIVGGSMVGMSLACMLAKRGVKGCITVEKHSGTAIHPRAALFHPRTMQIYRQLGLYDAMVAESAKHYDENAGIVAVESLAGKFQGTWMANMNEGIESISPTSRVFLTQQMFEPLLKRKAVGDGADLRFSTEMIRFQADTNGVTALLRNVETGEKRLIRAKYLVACDGNRSRVRDMLGIRMKGHGLLSRSLTIYFNADVGRYVEGRYNGVIYVNNPTVRGFFRLDKSGTEGFLVVNTAGEQGTEASRYPADGITDERADELLRAAIGADVDFKIRLVTPWRAVCDVAERFVDESGRVLLAGDSAHTVPPQGGFGGNSGVQDVDNLAWKLSSTLSGKAGPELVSETYEAERRPVARKTVDQVFERYIKRTAPELREVVEAEGQRIEDEIPEPWLELGYRYHSRCTDTDQLDELMEDPATSKARPGSLAHHCMISVQGQELEGAMPLADLLGDDFVLIVGKDADGWYEASKALVMANHLPQVSVYRLCDYGPVYARYNISSQGAVLIRPDGVVAWSEAGPATMGRAAMGVPDPRKTLLRLMERLLCLAPARSQQPLGTAHLESHQDLLSNASTMSLAQSLYSREKALVEHRDKLKKALEQTEAQLADVRKLGVLQDEMALLSMKVMPLQENPPEYTFEDCIRKG